MTSDYTKEIGMRSNKKMLSRPVAFALLAIVAVGVSFGVAGVLSQSKESHSKEAAAAPAAVTPPAAAPAK